MAAAEQQLGIPVAEKDNPNVKNHLGYLARSDYQHDFGEAQPNTPQILNAGLPVDDAADNRGHGDEPQAFMSVIGAIAAAGVENTWPYTQEAAKELKRRFLEACPDMTAGPGAAPLTFSTGCRHGANQFQKLHDYTGKKINIIEKNAAEITENLTLTNCVLVIDFDNIHLLDALRSGPVPQGVTISIVTNPQTINDPAPKTKYCDPQVFNEAGSGVKIKSLVDVTQEPIVYSTYDADDSNPNNTFFSKYKFILSPIKEKKTFLGKNTNLVTNLTVENGKNISDVKDSKLQNSKVQVMKNIRRFLNIIAKAFVVNEGAQRKRSGDWFAVLSCFDVPSRKYKDGMKLGGVEIPIPAGTTQGSIFFVTHDQIAAAYALMMGINVMYVVGAGAEKWLYLFQNSKYIQNYNPEENMRANIEGGKDALVARLAEYIVRRNTTISNLVIGGGDTLQTLITSLDTHLDNAQIDYVNTKKKCLDLLKKAIIITFFTESCPDVTGLYATLNQALPAAVNFNKKNKIRAMYLAYNSATSILGSFDGNISPTLLTKIKNLDIIKKCMKWEYTTKAAEPRFKALEEVGKAGEDNVVFLAYLKHFSPSIRIGAESAKGKIVGVFTKFLRKLTGPGEVWSAGGARTKEVATRNFKALAEEVRIHMRETEPPAGEPDVFTELAGGVNNPLRIEKVTAENQHHAGGEVGNRPADDKFLPANQENPEVDGDMGGAELVVANAPEAEVLQNAGGTIQKGGYGTTADMRIGNPQLVTALSQSTYPLLTGHVLQDGHAAQALDEFIGGLVDPALEGGGSKEIIAKFPPELPIYIALEGLRNSIPELLWHPDYEYYVYYYQFLECLAAALPGVEDKGQVALAIRELLLTLNTTVKGKAFFEEMFQDVKDRFAHIYHVTTTISYMICGNFDEYTSEDDEFLKPFMEVFSRQSVKEYIQKVIDAFQQVSDVEFYTDGNPTGRTINLCNYDLQAFASKVSILQEKMAEHIITPPLDKHIYQGNRQTRINKSKPTNLTLKRRLHSMKRKVARQPLQGVEQDLHVPKFVSARRGGSRTRKQKKKRSSFKHKTVKQ